MSTKFNICMMLNNIAMTKKFKGIVKGLMALWQKMELQHIHRSGDL